MLIYRNTASLLEELRDCVKSVLALMEGPHPDADQVMIQLHGLWGIVASVPDRHTLLRLPDEIHRFASETSVQPDFADYVSKLGRGLVLRRSGSAAEAAAQLSDIPFKYASDTVFSLVTDCWGGLAWIDAAEAQKAHKLLLRARSISLTRVDEPGSIHGLLGLLEAAIELENGNFRAALATLDRIRGSFDSRHDPEVIDFKCYEAEARSIRAETLREMGRYKQSLAALAQAESLRLDTRDLLGQVSVLLERARIDRFRAEYDEAFLHLQRADMLLEDSGFADWQARVVDQRGDVFRIQKNYSQAERYYRDARSLAAKSQNQLLQAHLDNSFVRLHEDRQEFELAWKILEARRDFWKPGSKEYGKQLYLMGSIQAQWGNARHAVELLKQSIREFERCEMQSYAALAHDRLARALLDLTCPQGLRKPEAEEIRALQEQACQAWAKALRLAGKVETEKFLERIRERINELEAANLVAVLSDSIAELALAREEEDSALAVEASARDRHMTERTWLGHFILPYARHYLWPPPDGHARILAPMLDRLLEILECTDWYRGDFSRSPAQPDPEVDVRSLFQKCCETVGRESGVRLEVLPEQGSSRLSVNKAYVERAFLSLVRGAHSAFGTRRFDVGLQTSSTRPDIWVFDVRLAEPCPQGFEHAHDLIFIKDVWKKPELAGFFRNGYTGDFTLLEFLITVPLWGGLDFVTESNTIRIELPQLHRREG